MDIESNNQDVGAESIAAAMQEAAGAASSSEAPASTESKAAVTESSPSTQAEAVAPTAVATPAEAYQPSFKFKVKDKEMEFDDFVKANIKTKEQEAKARELYEKSYGLDEVKTHREEIRTKFNSYREQTEPIMNTVREATGYFSQGKQALDQGNIPTGVKAMEAFFQKIGVDNSTLQKYMYHQLSIPQEQKQQYNQQWEQQQQFQQMQSQHEQLQQQFQQTLAQQRQAEVEHVSSSNPVAQAYDQKFGAGAFRDAIIKEGQLRWFTQKQDVPANVIANELAQKFSWLAQSPAPQAAPQAVHSNQPLPVIPVANGGSVSAVAKMPESLEDLERIRDAKLAAR